MDEKIKKKLPDRLLGIVNKKQLFYPSANAKEGGKNKTLFLNFIFSFTLDPSYVIHTDI